MPRIFDNLELGSSLLSALQETLALSSRADFCVGYLNLRGWGGLAPYVDDWSNDDGPCRVLIGMQRLPHEELRRRQPRCAPGTRQDRGHARRRRTDRAGGVDLRLPVRHPRRSCPQKGAAGR